MHLGILPNLSRRRRRLKTAFNSIVETAAFWYTPDSMSSDEQSLFNGISSILGVNNRPEFINLGHSGDNYVWNPNLPSANYLQLNPSPVADFTGTSTFDALIEYGAPESADAAILSNWDNTVTNRFVFGMNSSGNLRFWAGDSSNTFFKTSSASVGTVASPGDKLWVRAEWIPLTGVRFYTSLNAVTWTELGTIATDTVVTGFTPSTATPWRIGRNSTNTYEFPIFDIVVNSSVVFNADNIGNWSAVKSNTGFQTTVVTSPTVATEVAGLGSTNDSDTNDPVVLPHDGEDYYYFPPVAGNAIQVLHPTWTAGWTKQTGKLRIRTRSTSGQGRPITLGYKAIVQISSADVIQIQVRDIDSWNLSAGVAMPWTHGDLIDLGVENDATSQHGRVYWRPAASTPLADEGVDDWTGWTLLIDFDTSGFDAHDTTILSTFLGSNSTSGQHGDYDFFEGVIARDGADVVSWSGLDESVLTITRASSGVKITAVDRPKLVFDGTDDYVQLPASATPTFDTASGKHTVVLAAIIHDDSASADRLYSSESASTSGLLIYHSSSTTMNFQVGSASATRSIVQGNLEIIATVVDDGEISGYRYGDGLSAASALSGSITHTDPRLGLRAYATSAASTMELLSFVDLPGVALTEEELNAISERLINNTYRY